MEILDNFICDLFDSFKTIASCNVPFSNEVRELCEQNMCGFFGKSWTCPPAVQPLAELQNQLLRFSRVMIVTKVYQLTDNFDWEGMQNGARDFQQRILKVKKEIIKEELDRNYLVLGAGACNLCKACTYEQRQPCKRPKHAIVSVEACGIDVMTMLTENGLKYNNGANTVTYVGTIFSKETL